MPTVFITTGYLAGFGENHFEITIGGGVLYYNKSLRTLNDYKHALYGGPIVSLAYRYKKTGDNFTYGIGIGLPEGAVARFGFAF